MNTLLLMLGKWIYIVPLCLCNFQVVQAQQLQTNGAAQYMDEQCAWFQATANFSSGTIWTFEKYPFTSDLDLSFRVNFQCAEDTDGLTFVLQSTGSFAGNYGERLGVVGLAPSIVIEVDVDQNGDDGDPAFDHLGVLLDGNLNHADPVNTVVPVALVSGLTSIDKCVDHWLQIKYEADDKALIISFDCVMLLRYTIPAEVQNRINEFHWGCTAGLGSSVGIIEICPNFLEMDLDTMLIDDHCLGDTIQLTSQLEGLSYQWFPTEFFASPFEASNWFINREDDIYRVEVVDDCGRRKEEVWKVANQMYEYYFNIDTVLCEGETLAIDISSQPFASQVVWNTGDRDSYLTLRDSGLYYILGSDGICLLSDTIKLRAFTSLYDLLGPWPCGAHTSRRSS
jgi:hypothetical protein